MFLTNVLLKKARSKNIVVRLRSVCSDHTVDIIRERAGEKLEVFRFDPLVQMQSIYREVKKIRSTRLQLSHQKGQQQLF